jgi:multicomponent Na+:H+ antiporter subunit D
MELLVISLPFAIAIAIVVVEFVFPSQKYRWAGLVNLLMPVVGLALSALLVWQTEAGDTDNVFFFNNLSQIILTLLFGFTAISLLVAYFTDQLKSGRYSPAALAVCGTINAALYINNVFIVTLCFVAAEFFSIIAVVDLDTEDEERFVRTIKSAVRYLIVTVLFGLLLFVAQVFLERLRLDPQQTGLINIIIALAVTGFALRLGVFPFNLWVPQMVEDAPALANWLVLGLINGAVIIFLVDFLEQNPTLLFASSAQSEPVMTLGMAGAVLSGVFAIAQSGFGKMLAYVISGNLSLVLFAVATTNDTGIRGALFEAGNLTLVQLLIFTCLSVVNYCNFDRSMSGLTGLGRRTPVAAVGLIFGLLGLAGVPPVSGFAGKYLILQSAAQEGIVWALLGGLAVTLWLIAYLRFFHNAFMGRDVPGLKTRPEPIGGISVILSLVAVTIIVGIWPAFPLDWLGAALPGVK